MLVKINIFYFEKHKSHYSSLTLSLSRSPYLSLSLSHTHTHNINNNKFTTLAEETS